MSDKKVDITVSGSTISVFPDPVQPKKNLDKVKWECAQQFSIGIQGSTLQSSQNGGNGKWTATSNTFPTVETIKYTVTSGGNELDPEVDVQP